MFLSSKSPQLGDLRLADEIATCESVHAARQPPSIPALPPVVPTAHGDRITDNATTFRTVFSTGEIGEALANYLHFVLGSKRAAVIFKDNGYGRRFADGFKNASERLGIAADYLAFTTSAQREEAARRAAVAPDQPVIVLGMTFEDAVPVMVTLRRQAVRGVILGTATMARAGFVDLFKGADPGTVPGDDGRDNGLPPGQ